MTTGAITGYIDVAQLVLYVFWIFFIGLVIYLRREDKREGYPLEAEGSSRVRVVGFPDLPEPKTFVLPHGGGFIPYQIGRFRHGFDDPHQVARHGLARLGRGRLVEASFGHMPRQPIKPQRSGQALERCGIGIEAFLVGVRGTCDGDHPH
jgi:hypothetical protein